MMEYHYIDDDDEDPDSYNPRSANFNTDRTLHFTFGSQKRDHRSRIRILSLRSGKCSILYPEAYRKKCTGRWHCEFVTMKDKRCFIVDRDNFDIEF